MFKYIGYDVDETQRKENAREHDEADPKYTKVYPLMDWDWTREDCAAAIQQEGLPLPGKSSCFFCPSMKKREIRTLYHKHRDLYERAIAIEDKARTNLITVRGLGRDWARRDFVEADQNQPPCAGCSRRTICRATATMEDKKGLLRNENH